VLDKGVIAERGGHEALLAKGGLYAALWNRQREVDAAQETLRRAGEIEEAEETAIVAPTPRLGGLEAEEPEDAGV